MSTSEKLQTRYTLTRLPYTKSHPSFLRPSRGKWVLATGRIVFVTKRCLEDYLNVHFSNWLAKVVVSISVYKKIKVMNMCIKYLEFPPIYGTQILLAIVDHYSIQDRQFITFCQHLRLLLDLKSWSVNSYDYCRWRVILCIKAEKHGSIDTRS